MPNRILKESICTSDSVDGLSWFEEVLFYRLIVNCDDYGRFDGRAAIIKNRLFPLKEKLTVSTVSAAINTLASAGLVVLYEFEGKPFLYLPTWNEHQSVRAKRSKYPPPDETNVKSSEIICKQMHADVPVIQSNTESNPNPNPNTNTESARSRFTPPTLDEVASYCRERGNSVDAQKWYDHYSANGWMVGKNRMKDWKASVRTWERSEYADNKPTNRSERDDSKALAQMDRARKKMRDHSITPAKPTHETIDALDKLMERMG